MRKAAILALIFIFLSTSVYAAEPDGWNIWMYLGEALAGFGLGFGAAMIVGNAMGGLEERTASLITCGTVGLASAGGVILVGEVFGAKSENAGLTFGLTVAAPVVTSLVLSAVTTDTAAIVEDDGLSLESGPAMIGSIFADPHIAAVTYNIVKKPEMPKKSSDLGFELKSYSTYLTDSGGDMVPVYGLALSF